MEIPVIVLVLVAKEPEHALVEVIEGIVDFEVILGLALGLAVLPVVMEQMFVLSLALVVLAVAR